MKFNAIFDRADGRFNYSEIQLDKELKVVRDSSNFLSETRKRANEIMNDSTGGVFFSPHNLCDSGFKL